MASCINSRLPLVEIQTTLGNIVCEIDTIRAPVTAQNFLLHVINDNFNDALFYRAVRLDNQPENTVKIEVIQGGLFEDEKTESFSPVRHETTKETGIKHKDGTISMARIQPGSATTEFFICIGKQPELDFGGKRNPDKQGFAAFGRVTEGMKIIRNIHTYETKNQYLIEPVKIEKIAIIPKNKIKKTL